MKEGTYVVDVAGQIAIARNSEGIIVNTAVMRKKVNGVLQAKMEAIRLGMILASKNRLNKLRWSQIVKKQSMHCKEHI